MKSCISSLGSIFSFSFCAGYKRVAFAGLSLVVSLSTAQLARAQAVTLVPSLSTYAGNGNTASNGDGGAATAAAINNPEGIAYDKMGNTYIADYGGNRIRLVNSAGVISNLFGPVGGAACANPTAATGACGDGGVASAATFNNPTQMQFDAAGNLYIADKGDHRIRKITATNGVITGASIISTVAGTGTAGTTGDGGAGTAAQINNPHGLVLDQLGNLYIAEQQGNVIRKVVLSTDTISTFVGAPGNAAGFGGDGGQANVAAAKLNTPTGLAVDSSNNLYIGDFQNGRIRKVTVATNIISTFVGTGLGACPMTQPTAAAPNPVPACGDGGPGSSATLNAPTGVYVDPSNNVIIGDATGARVREVFAATGNIATIAGTSQECNNANQSVQNAAYPACGDGGAATKALVSFPILVSFSPQGNVQFVDQYDNKIRQLLLNTTFPNTAVGAQSAPQNILLQINTAGTIVTSITVPNSAAGTPEYAVGTVSGCTVGGTTGNAVGTICVVPVKFSPVYPGQQPQPVIVVTNNGTFRFALVGIGVAPQAVLLPGTLSTNVGTGVAGGTGNGGQATAAQLNQNRGLTFDFAGNLYIGDRLNNQVRKVTSAGVISSFAGGGTTNYQTTSGGQATAAALNLPESIRFDGAGNAFIADYANHAVVRVDATTGAITAFAGTGTAGYSGDGGLATAAKLGGPDGLAVDYATGNVYIADGDNSTIRMVNVSTGLISTVAGNGTGCTSSTAACGDGGLATAAQLHNPHGLVLDASGNLFIADSLSNRIRQITATTGVITTIAGTGAAGYSGDGGAGINATFNSPFEMVADAAGDLYIADSNNQAIRFISAATGIVTTIVGNGTTCTLTPLPACGDGGPSNVSALSYSTGVALDSVGNVYASSEQANRVRKITINPVGLTYATTPVGNTSTDSPQTEFLTNIGNAALTLNQPSTGTNPSISTGFTESNTQTCPQLSTTTGTLAAGAKCSYIVSFTPTAVGTYNGSLVETDNSLNATAATQTVTLTGTGYGRQPDCVADDESKSVDIRPVRHLVVYGQR